jgi:hypothetical protein
MVLTPGAGSRASRSGCVDNARDGDLDAVTWLWGVAAAAALLWPDHVSGPFDGVPLDRPAEAILVGVVFPALWWLYPRFLRCRAARLAVVLLVAWRAAATVLFVPDGWCLRFAPARPFTVGAAGAPHAWDLRADWRAADPSCSAIMTRPYEQLADFPAWFFNLPPAAQGMPEPADRPPVAVTPMTVQGFVRVAEGGLLRIDTGPDVTATIQIDGGPAASVWHVDRGVHTVNVTATLAGDRWMFAPMFNGRSLFSSAIATVKRPSRIDLLARPWAGWIPAALVCGLFGAWLVSALMVVADRWLVLWAAGSAAAIAWLVAIGRIDDARWLIPALAFAAALPMRRGVRNALGAFVAVGVPWLTFVVASCLPLVGRFSLYSPGNDWSTFQSFSYRIVLQGFWLEGGSATFWFQPFYRWIVGVLHAIFGDSSVGEWYWDGACLLAGAMFSYRVVRRVSGFRWGLVAAVMPLAVFVLSDERGFLGRGLSEISSAGLIYLAATFVIRSRHRSTVRAVVAGGLATLGFYTRLNNLPMAIGTAAFALPLCVPARCAWLPWTWWRRVAWRSLLIVPATIAVGLLLFAWRTWHYTGVFSVLYGTARDHLAVWQPGMAIATFLNRAAESVLMVLTLNDPPHYDPYALPVLAGAAVAVGALFAVPGLNAPLPLAGFFFATIAGALVSRGSAYSGRFSLHAIPVTCALTVSAVAELIAVLRRRLRVKSGQPQPESIA